VNVTVLDDYFKISERGSTISREVRGGVVTFFTMAYIVVLNPLILGFSFDSEGEVLGGGNELFVNLPMIAAATALVAGVVTILMGVVANYPLALATGLGLNAFVAFVITQDMTWADAMGLVVLEGLIILALVLTGFRKAVFEAVPRQLKIAISVGIGLFIALIGFVDAGFVHKTPILPTTTVPVSLGWDGQLQGWPVLVFVFGMILLLTLHARAVKGAILISIAVTTVVAVILEKVVEIGGAGTYTQPVFGESGPVPGQADSSFYNPTGWGLSVPAWPDKVVDKPDFSLLGDFSLFGAWENAGIVTAALFVFTLLLADFFDTVGTMTAIGAEADLLDEEGNPPNTQRILIVDSIAAAAGGAASISSNTSYIESASGVAEGARTGLASVVTGVLFLLATFFAPLVQMVPSEAAVPALVLVGFLMMRQISGIDWDDMEIALPCFLTIVLMPFTFSITAGIGAGFVTFVLLKVLRGKVAEVHPLMWIVSVLFVVYFAINPITSWLT
jgi:AGZA family xanthine/uracil permease-like MFS transporter